MNPIMTRTFFVIGLVALLAKITSGWPSYKYMKESDDDERIGESFESVLESKELIDRGLQSFNDGKYQMAIHYYDQFLTHHSSNALIRKLRLNCLIKTKDWNTATSDLVNVLIFNPENSLSEISSLDRDDLLEFGFELYKREKYKEAIPFLTRAIEMNPEKARATDFATLGICHEKIGNFNEAIMSYEKAVEKSPSVPFIQHLYVDILFRTKRYEDAVKWTLAQSTNKEKIEYVGERLFSLGQFEQALLCFTRSGDYYRQALCHWKMGDLEAARQKFGEGQPTFPEARIDFVELLFEMKLDNEAKNVLQTLTHIREKPSNMTEDTWKKLQDLRPKVVE